MRRPKGRSTVSPVRSATSAERFRASARSRFVDEIGAVGAADEALCRACPVVMLPAGARRTASELPAARFLFVEEGVVISRSLRGRGRRSRVLARSAPGSVLTLPLDGEVVESLSDAWLTAVPQQVWQRLIAIPEHAAWLVAKLEESIVRERETAQSLAGIRHVDRVRAQLLELARDHGRVCRDGVRIELPLTHELIADMVGCSRETVTRAFDDLQRDLFVMRSGRHYVLLVAPESLTA